MIVNRFLEETEGGKIRIIRKYPELILFPEGYNWFHLVCLYFNDKKLLQEVINAKVPFIRDCQGNTPLHYLVKGKKGEVTRKNPALINMVLNRFSDILDIEEDNFEILQSFDSIFVELMEMGVPGLKNFLEHFIVKPKTVEKEEIPLYVNIKGKRAKQIVTDPVPLLRNNLYKRMLEESEGDANIIAIRCIPTPLDYSPLSDHMEKIVKALLNTDEEDLLRTKVVENLIDYNWANNRMFHISVAAVLSIYMIAFSIYASDSRTNYAVQIPLISIIGLYTVGEIIKLVAMGGIRAYFSDVWNFTDVGMIIIQITTLSMTFAFGRGAKTSNAAEDLAISWLMSFCLFFGYAKWFSYFRIWESTSK